jgi:hypothetical protein
VDQVLRSSVVRLDAEGGGMNDDTGTAMARKCATAALLAVLNERDFEAVHNTVGAAVDAVIKAHTGLKPERSAPLDPAQAAFETAVLRLISVLTPTDRGPVERTPETVLRAMWRTYGDAALDAEKVLCAVLDVTPETAAAAKTFAGAAWLADQVRLALARLLAKDAGWERTFVGRKSLQRDFEARLSGRRPLDAPPMEES